jgi:putative nucleotidyltransferase with HDIG domain
MRKSWQWREHSERVARVAVALAILLSPADIYFHNKLHLAALFHDIGKIRISDNILNKPGHLAYWEMNEIKKHPAYGEEILKPILPDPQLLAIVLHHHEAWNGQGYPGGLKEEGIPFGARLVAVADTYDSMTSDRPYRNGMRMDGALHLLGEGAGSQWDARIVSMLMELAESGELTELTRRTNAP